jgi:hypothetical protein
MGNRHGVISKMARVALTAVWILAATCVSWALDGTGVVRLKKAGVSDQTLELMAKERTLETAAFTVDEIVAMKAAGIGEKTLQTLISEGSFMKDREPVVFGNDLRSIRMTTAADIIALKKAGVGDDVLQAIVAVNRPNSEMDRQEALRLLDQMGIWVEPRTSREPRSPGR